jgi:serine/threonine-protein kinase
VTEDSFAHGLVGVTLDGRYRLDAVLGEGGMGSVFRATQLAMDRKVAVKLLKPHLTTDRVALERFSREARATLKVASPHAVKVVDFGVTPLGDYYMVLEYLDGRTVQRELEIDGLFSPARTAHIARQALHALGAAHGHGLIHRDVKPENLLLMRHGSDGDYTKVLDFGVAKLMQGGGGAPAMLALTAAGMVFGTPEFMSPEQACGQPLDGRSDLYSLAATMFVMLTGTTLFEGTTAIEFLTHHARTPAPQLAMVRPELAAFPGLDAVLQRCLAKQRDDRPASAAEMARLLAELEPVLARGPAAATPRIANQPTPTHISTFVPVLRDPSSTVVPVIATVIATADTPAAPVAVLAPALAAPASAVAPAPAPVPPSRRPAKPAALATTAVAAGPLVIRRPPRRTRWVVWLGGVALASIVGVGVGLAVERKDASSSSARGLSGASTGSPALAHAAVPIATQPVVAGADPAGPPDSPDPPPPAVPSAAPARAAPAPSSAPATEANAARPGSAASVSSPSRPAHAAKQPPRHAAPPVAPDDPQGAAEIDQLLREAEDAYRNHLPPIKQFAAAESVLRADPHNARARYLAGDALIKSGDIENGCKYLAVLRRDGAARERARVAGCPSD